jgi:hypothetical protein
MIGDGITPASGLPISSNSNIKNGAGTNSLMQKEDAGKYTDAKPNFV